MTRKLQESLWASISHQWILSGVRSAESNVMCSLKQNTRSKEIQTQNCETVILRFAFVVVLDYLAHRRVCRSCFLRYLENTLFWRLEKQAVTSPATLTPAGIKEQLASTKTQHLYYPLHKGKGDFHGYLGMSKPRSHRNKMLALFVSRNPRMRWICMFHVSLMNNFTIPSILPCMYLSWLWYQGEEGMTLAWREGCPARDHCLSSCF